MAREKKERKTELDGERFGDHSMWEMIKKEPYTITVTGCTVTENHSGGSGSASLANR